MTILDGKKTAQEIKAEIAQEVAVMTQECGRSPHLAVVLVGHSGASETYVKNKMAVCKSAGIRSTLVRFETDVNEDELLECVAKLNDDEDIDGFIVQLPLPAHIDDKKIIEAIAPDKDVDGFHPSNFGRLALGLPCFAPATPLGILTLLQRYDIETSGKRCVILGRSNIVGKPLSILMMLKNGGDATVTVCHSHTKNIAEICREADIIIAAIGQPHFVTADMVKEGAVVVDVGITRVDAPDTEKGYVLQGDVDFKNVAPHCSFITPVPGGVGPMTICSLVKNTLTAAKRHQMERTAKSEEFYKKGNQYRKEENFQQAINCYLEAIALNPASPAVEAKQMLDDILNFYNKDAYNP